MYDSSVTTVALRVSRDLEFKQYCLYCISMRLETCYSETNFLLAKYKFFKESQTASRAFCSVESVCLTSLCNNTKIT